MEQVTDPKLWPIADGAAFVGVTVDMLTAGIDGGQIPVALHRLGVQNKRFVNVEQLKEWARSRRGTSLPAERTTLLAARSDSVAARSDSVAVCHSLRG